ncbi:MAG: EamA family transporter [Acidobacteria bacterium]|nr:EamA family transporter [Acidobacteriota bacterium]MBS1866318.1 EamA family transporter [Acidobacteriota bacterium]
METIPHPIPAWLIFTVIALVFWGVTGVTQKLSTNRISSALSFLWFAYAMVAISIVLALTVSIHWQTKPMTFLIAAAGGTLNGLGALTSFVALESGGKASVVISLISLFPLVTVAFAVIVLQERLTLTQTFGVVLAILAAILLSMEPKPATEMHVP